ncbi:exopolysaccharide biosynthesis protein [Jannaschia sp. CCS1]|uniref:exopolysaccharide biosynthesis protein n=1 Tax=Jannaschia sp. (strain CCS1) TaxID=290400 RepID=UPI0000539FF0|nr:exopolysaccharide biosynthesis protein [Jannaschia sp. CCS1]ABD53366.1 Exopolysaccharide synthesis ExoD [Jannaschia sp. CCS1]
MSEPHPPLAEAPPASLPDIIDRVLDAARVDVTDIRTILQSFGRASFTPVLLLPAMAVATPLSGIPLFSSFAGLLIALVSAQMLARRNYLWLPDWILRRQITGGKLRAAFERIRPVAVWIDARTAQRFRLLSRRPLIFLPQLLCLVSGLMMPVLEFVPFSSSVVGIGVAILALGMLARDGALIVLGLLPYAGVVWLVYRVV